MALMRVNLAGRESKQFFFEKKNQKTFGSRSRGCWASAGQTSARSRSKSFFAAFFSKKAGLSSFRPAVIVPCPYRAGSVSRLLDNRG
jgi:hypothetical protein